MPSNRGAAESLRQVEIKDVHQSLPEKENLNQMRGTGCQPVHPQRNGPSPQWSSRTPARISPPDCKGLWSVRKEQPHECPPKGGRGTKGKEIHPEPKEGT